MNKSGSAADAISLPKGGGAIKGIGETFQPNLFSGTGNHSIPIATSPGRSGFGPNLSLQYSSGNGNGPFGLGWQLSLPRITRKTEKGLPRYDDSDVFVMSGAEDLVPCLKKVVDPATGKETWQPQDPIHRPPYTVSRYRPRTEGLFARIERWENDATHEVHWRATTKENITSVYGASPLSRIADPENPDRVYEWLLQETFDAVGNHILYEYAKDDPRLYTHEDPTVDLPEIFDRNRKATQLYIRRIYYGNLPNPLVDSDGKAIKYPDGTEIGHLRNGRHYAFEVVFDYGDWEIPTKLPHPEPVSAGQQEFFGPDPSLFAAKNPVPIRQDCFSSFRAGFEIRTLRRCRRVLMFHHFAELGSPTLVRSTDFTYQNNAETIVSFLTAATVTGYQKDSAGKYQSASMPPVTFGYTEFQPEKQHYQSIGAEGNDMPPQALNNPDFALVDLFGDGLPDVLNGSPAGFRYWKNLGGGKLDRPRSMPQVPAGIALSQPGVGFGDMGGDGQVDLLVHSGPLQGFFETTPDGTWQKFKRYEVLPSFDFADPNLRMVDLTGDGLSDALLTADQSFLWFECLGEQGFAGPKRIARQHDFDSFPDVFFNDPDGRVRLADMTGDGLNDIVLVHNGRIDYWPNLGYGRFGKRITMANAPHLDFDFNPKRLFLADVNGNGCADLVYVDLDRVHFWFNQSGNRWSEEQVIAGTPRVSNVDSIQFADIFGTGTATLLWSYDFNNQPGGNYKALDFCGGIKPYVLTEMSNNMGATTRVSYAPSTKYFIEDQANGTPWVTKLPFPVQVVDKVEVIDHVSKTKMVTTYKYHHGYFDGREREFRGFGRVDQFDTETLEDFTQSSLHDGTNLFTNNDKAFHVPPVETRTWFHTGIYFAEEQPPDNGIPFDFKELTKEFRAEFYHGDQDAVPIDDHKVETGDTPHEAYRALRGAVLHTEVYARDGSAKAEQPYQMTDNRYQVRQVQPKDGNHHAVYFSSQMESVSYHYERNPADPRIGHSLTLQLDAFGNPLKSLAIGYGRRHPDPALPTPADQDKQTQTLITYTENSFTNGIDDPKNDPDNYRTPLASETRTYELTGFKRATDALRFSVEQWTANDFALLSAAVEIGYEETADLTKPQKRLIEHLRTLYRKNDLTVLLPLGAVESLALPGEAYKLALTPILASKVYGARVTDTMLVNDGGYVHSGGDANWWIPSGRAFYSLQTNDAPAQELIFAQQHFFLPHRARDPFANTGVTKFDAYNLLVRQTVDPVGNTTTAEHDYRMLQPFRVTDPNGNRAEVAFDILGLVAGTAVMGKTTETKGDILPEFIPDPSAEQLQDFLADPLGKAAGLLGQATTRIIYDLDRYRTTQQPAFAATLGRETHVSDPLPPGGLKIQVSFSYSDGFGREIQKKIQAEPGPLVKDGPIVSPRWVGSGWTIFNNKGKPVRQYEPFFSQLPEKGHLFEFGVQVGISPTLFYDPLERVVGTLHPNHTWEKVIFDPWRQESWDVNDTVLIADAKADADVGPYFELLSNDDYLPSWQTLRTDPAFAAEAAQLWPEPKIRAAEKDAATKAAVHANTPTIALFDTLGRPFLTIAHNRFERDSAMVEEKYPTRVELDIEGNQRTVRDAIVQNGDTSGRIVMRYDYDMLGNRIHQASMEAGERWMLGDVTGKPIRAWDSRGHAFRTEYDVLRRPKKAFVQGADPQNPNRETLFEQTEYGEGQSNDKALNLRTRVFKHFDTAGIVTSIGRNPVTNQDEAYDFKGNLLRSSREVNANYKGLIDWNTAQPSGEPFSTSTIYDALNRPTAVTAPDKSIYRPTYNEANLLDKVDVNLRGAATATLFVTNIDYDAKGQRIRIDYGNGASTTYEYDPKTLRLIHLYTRRGAAFTQDCDNPQPPPPTIATPEIPPAGKACGLQNLHYTYDSAGNITHIQDTAQQTIYFKNKRVEPSADYTYDAIYRLIEATGREHLGQVGGAPIPHSYNDAPRVGLLHPGDGNAMGTYLERYVYDAVGNFASMHHIGSDPANRGWTRTYVYSEPSALEPNNQSNRLTSTSISATPETYSSKGDGYDTHGNMLRMPQLTLMQWDFRDQLQMSRRQAVNAEDTDGVQHQGEQTYYVYDGSGQRVRKVTEGKNGTRMKERIYLGGFEIYREYGGSKATVSLERETLHVMDDKQRIALIETKTKDTSQPSTANPQPLIRYQFCNHLSSASLELDSAGQIISYEEYYPYGSTSYKAGRSVAEVSLKRYRYTGMERDDETGFTYHKARYYAPWLGRWTSCDPIEIKGGVNLYIYSHNNSIRFSDPEGNDPPPDAVIQSWYRGNTFYYTETIYREGLYSRLERTCNPTTGEATQKLYRRDDRTSDWTDVTQDALNDDFRHNTPTPSRELSVEWNMPGQRSRNLGEIAGEVKDRALSSLAEMLISEIPPSLVIPYVKDSILMDQFEFTPQGQNPYQHWAGTIGRRWSATGARKTSFWLNKVVSVAALGAEVGSIGNSVARASSGLNAATRLARSAEIVEDYVKDGLQRVDALRKSLVATSKAKYGIPKNALNMAISRSQALNRMEGLSEELVNHLDKIAKNPLSRDVPHWKGEIRAWIGEIERLNQHVGKKTGQEWANRIAVWKSQLGE